MPDFMAAFLKGCDARYIGYINPRSVECVCERETSLSEAEIERRYFRADKIHI